MSQNWTAEQFVQLFLELSDVGPYAMRDMVPTLDLELQVPGEPPPNKRGDWGNLILSRQDAHILDRLWIILKMSRPPLDQVNKLLEPHGIKFMIIKYHKELVTP